MEHLSESKIWTIAKGDTKFESRNGECCGSRVLRQPPGLPGSFITGELQYCQDLQYQDAFEREKVRNLKWL